MVRYFREALDRNWVSVVIAFLSGAVTALSGLFVTGLGAQLFAILLVPIVLLILGTIDVVRSHRQQWSALRQSFLIQLKDQLQHFGMFLNGPGIQHSIFDAYRSLQYDQNKIKDANTINDITGRFMVRENCAYQKRVNIASQIELAEKERRLSDDILAFLFHQTNELVAGYSEAVREFRVLCTRDGVLVQGDCEEKYGQFLTEYNQWVKHYRDELYPSVSNHIAPKHVVKMGGKPNLEMATPLTGARLG